jgi:hypothetical protein
MLQARRGLHERWVRGRGFVELRRQQRFRKLSFGDDALRGTLRTPRQRVLRERHRVPRGLHMHGLGRLHEGRIDRDVKQLEQRRE